MASIVKLDTGWRALVTVKKVRKTKVFKGKREAQQWAMITEAEMRDTKVRQLKTFADVLERYRDEVSTSKRSERWERIRIDAFLKDPALPVKLDVTEITPDILGKWRDARLKQVKPGTVIREFTIISSVLETARREWQYITTNPCKDTRRPRAPDHRDILLTRGQIRAVLAALGYSPINPIRTVSQAVGVAFLLSLRTGMRAGEVCSLRWDQVKDDHLSKVGTKTGYRDIPMPPKVGRIILKMGSWHKVNVFDLQTSTLDALFRKARKKSGLSGFTYHDSRHFAATQLARKVDALTLCKIFGWKNPKFALVYFNPTISSITDRLK